MTGAFAAKFVACLIAITLAEPPCLAAGGGKAAWQDLQRLNAGQEIEVNKTSGQSVRGAFVSVADQSITVRDKRQDVTIARAEISRVRLRPPKGGRSGWIGAAIGGGAGVAVGVGISQRFSDFSNLRPAIIGLSAGIGALIGAGIGLAVGGRNTTIYSK